MVEKEEFEKRAKKKKNGCTVVSFAISDCPVWLYKWFIDDTNRYNDVYWVRLKELHDILMMQEISAEQSQPAVEQVSKEDKEKDEKIKKSYLVKTFRDTEEVKIEKEEKGK